LSQAVADLSSNVSRNIGASALTTLSQGIVSEVAKIASFSMPSPLAPEWTRPDFNLANVTIYSPEAESAKNTAAIVAYSRDHLTAVEALNDKIQSLAEREERRDIEQAKRDDAQRSLAWRIGVVCTVIGAVLGAVVATMLALIFLS
jgi:hypothetical protein